VEILSGADYTFQAGNTVRLNSGFRVYAGATFKAEHSEDVNIYKSSNQVSLPLYSKKITDLSFNDVNKLGWLNIYPNPALNLINIEVGTDEEANFELRIINSLGQTYFIPKSLTKGINSIDISYLEKGVYHVLIVSESKIIERKKIVKL
jgi:hypothetical protein